jgi:hypothetical protein
MRESYNLKESSMTEYLDNPDHPFHGIACKLKRADENILNLRDEIDRFFKECKYPVIPNPNEEEWQDAVNYHRDLMIPLRFSVLAGETIHHLRSCLDHVVWYFATEEMRKRPRHVFFPIVDSNPPTEEELSRLETQIKGIPDARVRQRIIDFQPFHKGSDAQDDPLSIVHHMDIFDKHRELAIVNNSINIRLVAPANVIDAAVGHTQGEPVLPRELAEVGRAIKKNHQVSTSVAFAKFGKRKTQPVVPSLVQLINAIVKVVEIFETYIS